MIYCVTKAVSAKESKIVGYFESLESLEAAIEENKDALDIVGKGKIYEITPGFEPKRELVKEI